MSVNVTVSLDIRDFTRRLENTRQRHIPMAMAKTVTDMAKHAQKEIKKAIKLKYDRPVPYTVGGVRIQSATKRTMVSKVFMASKPSGGNAINSAMDYMRWSLEDKANRTRRVNFKTSSPDFGGMVNIMPGRRAPKTTMGNMLRKPWATRIQSTPLIREARIKGAPGIWQFRKVSPTATTSNFGPTRPTRIANRKPRDQPVRLLVAYLPSIRYKKILDFKKTGKKALRSKSWNVVFRQNFQHFLSTAR